MTQQRLKTQVLVIGAGISGSTSALTLADAGYEVTLIVPGKELDGGNSALAQGGIVYRSDPNDAKDLEKDILIAGHHHNYVKAVRHLCQHGPEAVERILMERAPIPFDRLDGKLDFTREGGHGKHRIVHCADHTGKTIMEGLLQAVRMSPNIRILTGRTAVDLITTDHHARYKEYRYQLDNQCLGAYVYNEDTREVETLLADFTVLATGGVGQVYLHTTNTAACTGSGIAMAQRAGVRAGWMGYVAPAEYQTYIDPWINIDASNIWFDGAAGSGQWGIDDYASAGVEVSVFTIDKDVDAAYYANYIDRLRAIATNYPKKLIGTFRK